MGNMRASSGTHFLGRFKNGQVYGHYWIGLCHSGYIHGVADDNGHATGDDMVFIYPDGETAYRYKCICYKIKNDIFDSFIGVNLKTSS